ncbi:unnamed protein product, partial [Staurois parvus]
KHNTVQTNPTNQPPQITVHTSKRRQAGRVNINWAGRYRGEQAENGRGHRPGSAGSKQRSTEGQAEGWSGSQARIRAGEVSSSSDQAGVSAKEQKQDTGPRTTKHQGRVCGSGH